MALRNEAQTRYIRSVQQRTGARLTETLANEYKSAQSNLGKGPRRGAVAHVCRKVPIGYNGAPQIRRKDTPSRGPIPTPTTCLIPGPFRPMMPNGIRI